MVLKRIPNQKRLVAVLGGIDGIQLLTGAGRTSIFNWIAWKQFPARYFLVMTTALATRGYKAPPSWWDQRGNHECVADDEAA